MFISIQEFLNTKKDIINIFHRTFSFLVIFQNIIAINKSLN